MSEGLPFREDGLTIKRGYFWDVGVRVFQRKNVEVYFYYFLYQFPTFISKDFFFLTFPRAKRGRSNGRRGRRRGGKGGRFYSIRGNSFVFYQESDERLP